MKPFDTHDKIIESNRIEGIEGTDSEEYREFERFMNLDVVTIDELERFVKVYQPNARLRDKPGLDVRVGAHIAPPGGVGIPHALDEILKDANTDAMPDPWKIHVRYETLHPFTDGNGRSGRMLWYWMMGRQQNRQAHLGFLHAFYYQTLRQATR